MGSPQHPYPLRRLIAYVLAAATVLGLMLDEPPAPTTSARPTATAHA